MSNRHMTWWHNAWWIRVDNGPHMRSARGRRRTWRAARQAAEQVPRRKQGRRDLEGRKRETEKGRKEGRKAAQTEQRGHPTPNPTRLTTATPAAPPPPPTTTTTTTTAAAAASTSNNSNTSNSSRSKQSSSMASALVSSACYLTVVSWLIYPILLSGLQHLRTHEYVGQPPVNVVDWTAEGSGDTGEEPGAV